VPYSQELDNQIDIQPSVAILIPAFNEATTVAAVVNVAINSKLGPVLVVDDGSTDKTSSFAKNAGAEVLKLQNNLGKAGAVVKGASFLDANILVLIDADLLGLDERHLTDLVKPLLEDTADMTRGDFKGGRWQTNASQAITPVLNGQRAIWREKLLAIPDLQSQGYGLEVTIAKVAKQENWRVQHVPLNGVSQVMKEEKEGRKGFTGFILRLQMYWQIIRSAFR